MVVFVLSYNLHITSIQHVNRHTLSRSSNRHRSTSLIQNQTVTREPAATTLRPRPEPDSLTSRQLNALLTPATDPAKNKVDTALAFPLEYISEVFKANQDIPGGTLSINSNGIARLYFKSDKYTCTYYQFANKKV